MNAQQLERLAKYCDENKWRFSLGCTFGNGFLGPKYSASFMISDYHDDGYNPLYPLQVIVVGETEEEALQAVLEEALRELRLLPGHYKEGQSVDRIVEFTQEFSAILLFS